MIFKNVYLDLLSKTAKVIYAWFTSKREKMGGIKKEEKNEENKENKEKNKEAPPPTTSSPPFPPAPHLPSRGLD